VTSGSRRTIVAVTDDANFRTNLILANATSSPVTASLVLLDSGGATIGSSTVPLLPLEMTQVLAVGRTLAGGLNVTNATLVLSTSTTGGSFAAYASVIDNGTNDPRTLLAR
jgi:acetyl-CoA carboxylase beta subunit